MKDWCGCKSCIEARQSGMKIVEELFRKQKELDEWKEDYKAVDKFASDLEKYLNRVEDRDIGVREFCEKRLEEEKLHYFRIKKEHPNSHVGKKKLAFCNGYKEALRNVLWLLNEDKVLLSIEK